MSLLPKVKPIYYLVAGLTLLVIILLARIIWFQPIPVIKTQDNEKVMRDSINLIMKQYRAVEQDKIRLHTSFDSLQNLKPSIQVIYKEKIKYIEKASNNYLDSLIRTSW